MSDKLCLLLDLDGVLVDVQGNDNYLVANSEYNSEWESRAFQFYKTHTRLLPDIEVLFDGLIDLIDKDVIDVYIWSYSLGPRALILGRWLRTEYLGNRPLPVIHRGCGDWGRNESIRWGYVADTPATAQSDRMRHYVKNPEMLVRMPVEWLDECDQLCMSEITVHPSSTLQVDDQPGRLRRSPHGIAVPPIFNSHGVARKLLMCIQRVSQGYQSQHTVGNSLRTCTPHLSQTVHRYFLTSDCDAGKCRSYTHCGAGSVENASGFKSELFTVFTLRT